MKKTVKKENAKSIHFAYNYNKEEGKEKGTYTVRVDIFNNKITRFVTTKHGYDNPAVKIQLSSGNGKAENNNIKEILEILIDVIPEVLVELEKDGQ